LGALEPRRPRCAFTNIARAVARTGGEAAHCAVMKPSLVSSAPQKNLNANMTKRVIKLTLEYDGTDFAGWQLQPKDRTVQGVLESALERLLKHPVRVSGSGRTDAGVHATGQVCSFEIEENIPVRAFREGLNPLLPMDVVIKEVQEAPEGFHARHSARGKRYRYRVLTNRIHSPVRDRYVWWQRHPWDFELLQQATLPLLGEHDFSSFRAASCQALQPWRILRKIELVRVDDEIWLTFDGTAFLKHMVRNLVGTLAEVAKGNRDLSWVKEVLEVKDRTLAGPTAPPQGLTLLEVFYE
jgi:tRNA pseudouridine38-40 synthase